MVMLGECPDDPAPTEIGCHNYFGYLRVDDVDAYYGQVQAAGAKCFQGVADKPWGMREFGVHTPEGHRIMIGQVIAR